MPESWRYVVMHHSLTQDHDRGMSADDIRRYHVEQKMWRDTAYHFLVERVEGVLVAIVGRPLDQMGAHAPGRNVDGLGVCLVGDFDQFAPEPETLEFAAHYIVAPLINSFRMDFPGCLIGHRDATAGRTCPGQHFDMIDFRARVARRLGYQ